MRGLLIKEFNMSSSKNFLITNLFMGISYYLWESVDYNSPEILSILRTITICVISSHTVIALSSESNNKHDKCFACLPYDRFQYVLSKYIIAALMPFVYVLFGLLFIKEIDFFLSIIIFIPLFSMPLYYHRGGKQGASYSILLIIFCDTLLVGLKMFLRERFNNIYIPIQGVPIFLAILATLCICTFLLSVHFFKKRDI